MQDSVRGGLGKRTRSFVVRFIGPIGVRPANRPRRQPKRDANDQPKVLADRGIHKNESGTQNGDGQAINLRGDWTNRPNFLAAENFYGGWTPIPSVGSDYRPGVGPGRQSPYANRPPGARAARTRAVRSDHSSARCAASRAYAARTRET